MYSRIHLDECWIASTANIRFLTEVGLFFVLYTDFHLSFTFVFILISVQWVITYSSVSVKKSYPVEMKSIPASSLLQWQEEAPIVRKGLSPFYLMCLLDIDRD